MGRLCVLDDLNGMVGYKMRVGITGGFAVRETMQIEGR